MTPPEQRKRKKAGYEDRVIREESLLTAKQQPPQANKQWMIKAFPRGITREENAAETKGIVHPQHNKSDNQRQRNWK
jgi:hypothetical protein